MRVPVEQIEAASKILHYAEEVEELNRRLEAGPHDLQVADTLAVDLTYYRAGLDVVFDGRIAGPVQATCARCAEAFTLSLGTQIRVILCPRAVMDRESRELNCDDLGVGFYDGDEIDVTALVHEHALLALPTRPLCDERCRGLCPSCGANLNLTTCDCAPQTVQPRLAVLRDLVPGRRGSD